MLQILLQIYDGSGLVALAINNTQGLTLQIFLVEFLSPSFCTYQMSKWSGLQQIANVAAKSHFWFQLGKKPLSNFATKEDWSIILYEIVTFKCGMLAPSTSYEVHNFIAKALTDDFKKFNFNKMLSMIHYAEAMQNIIKGDRSDQRAILQYSYATSIEWFLEDIYKDPIILL